MEDEDIRKLSFTALSAFKQRGGKKHENMEDGWVGAAAESLQA